MAAKKFRWTIQVEVDEKWVADGFNLTESRATAIFLRELGYATSAEVTCKVLKAPNADTIAQAQGFKDASAPGFK